MSAKAGLCSALNGTLSWLTFPHFLTLVIMSKYDEPSNPDSGAMPSTLATDTDLPPSGKDMMRVAMGLPPKPVGPPSK